MNIQVPCIGGDPTCPCQDGDLCHYVDDPVTGTKAMQIRPFEMWWLLFAICLQGNWYVCIDRDDKYVKVGGPYASHLEAFAGMKQLRLDHKEYK